MSSRRRRTTTNTTYSTQSTSGSETPGSSRRCEEQPPPIYMTRQQEQEELQALNDGLADYIDKVGHLEAASQVNWQDTLERSFEEIEERKVTSVKNAYERELADARRLLDETAREKARIQIEANKYKKDYEELLAKYNHRDREATALERRVEGLEAQAADLTAKLNEAEVVRKRLEKENKGLRVQITALEKQLAELKKQLEDETLLRVDLENRVQSLKEELSFKIQLHEQEVKETRECAVKEIEEVITSLKEEHEEHLLEALQEVRQQHTADLQAVRVELESLYEAKTAGYEMRIQELENQMAREREEFRLRLEQRANELTKLRQTMNDKIQEYSGLVDIRIRLDREIDAYRKLLETGRRRLDNTMDSSQTSQTACSPGRTPVAPGAKRRRVDFSEAVEEHSQQSTTSGYTRTASAKGGINIVEVDEEGKFIKLSNTTSEDIPVGTWKLSHTAGDQTTTIKFHRSLIVKAGKTVTVWSSDSGTTHNPPSDIVMKGKRWFVGEEMKTQLFNSDEEEMASCSMSRTTRSQRCSGPRAEEDTEEEMASCSTYRVTPRSVTCPQRRSWPGNERPDRQNCGVM